MMSDQYHFCLLLIILNLILQANSNVESMLKVGDSTLVISAGSGGMCGVWIETNSTYILFGK